MILAFNSPESFTNYRIWLKAFTWKNEGSPSQQLSLTTDVSGPASPVITNLTCADATTLHLEWFSPPPRHSQQSTSFSLKGLKLAKFQ